MSSAESIVVLSNVKHTCATFVWPDDLRYFVGYRFVEHEPKITADPLAHNPLPQHNLPPEPNGIHPTQPDWLENWQTTYTDPENPLHLQFQTFADGSAQAGVIENNGRQERTWRFIPEENGVRIWLRHKTHQPIPGAFILQQCLRFSGGIGHGFNRTVATVPFLSELLMQALGNANGTLTWVRKGGDWLPLPVPFTRYHTAVGQGIYDDSAGQIDCGLIVRESAPRERAPASYWLTAAPGATWQNWTAGLYWQRTATPPTASTPASILVLYKPDNPAPSRASFIGSKAQKTTYSTSGSKSSLNKRRNRPKIEPIVGFNLCSRPTKPLDISPYFSYHDYMSLNDI